MKNLKYLALTTLTLPIATISCNSVFNAEINKNITYKLSDNKNIFDTFTLEQLKLINKYQPIYSSINGVNLTSNDIKFSDHEIAINYNSKLTKTTQKPVQKLNLVIQKQNDFSYIKGSYSEPTNLTNYDILFEQKDYLFEQDDVDSPDINSILKRLTSENLNSAYNTLNPNFIPAEWIRANAWKLNTEQIKYWEDYILLDLLRFNFGNLKPIARVKIDVVGLINKNKNSNYKIAPIIKIDLLDKDNKSLLNKYKDKEWVLAKTKKSSVNELVRYLIPKENYEQNKFQSVFRNYDTKSDFSSTLDIDEDEVLFNEYVNGYIGDITLLMYKNQRSLHDNQYEFYVNPSKKFNHATARSFLWFLKHDGSLDTHNYSQITSNNKLNKYFEIEVPKSRKNIDKKYIIKEAKINNKYLDGSHSLIEILVEVQRLHDLQPKFYKWFSIDFNSHYHTFAKYKTKPDFDFDDNKNRYGFVSINREKGDFKVKKEQIIDPNDFFEKALLKLLSLQVYKFKDDLSLFDNKPFSSYEAHKILKNEYFWEQFKTGIGIDLFKYLIGKNTDSNTWIDDIAIDKDSIKVDEEPGTITFKIDFLDNKRKSILNEKNRSKVIKFYGFNGTNKTLINKQISQHNIISSNLDYILDILEDKNTNDKQNKIIDYFAWKE
ncbi:hypothetical protein E1I18_00095 [Mycoplasmopsis mucosicanis]|uniref:Lipoprotein n=1 Tax=Mycoplasmopsis mucosicanis TaxID=458208 RepID=A0A507SVF3_9BACT|nr:hypothetical protein [Mycoplasmopsis mucosicanis]TQC54165.1 hypothetical protein E1I18_00095 [Mycoplasmopsis mucosicanis]